MSFSLLSPVSSLATPALTPVVAAGTDPLGHVLDKDVIKLGGGLTITMNTLTLFIAGGLFVWIMLAVARGMAVGPASEGTDRYVTKGRLAQFVEVVVQFLRDKIVAPQLGEKTNAFLPFILSLFFFIWTCNLIGLVPLIDLQYVVTWFATGGDETKVIGGTPTGRLAVTGALAFIAFMVWNSSGIRANGVLGWLKHFTAGSPWFIWPIMIPVEVIGTFVKPAALMIRLFANMTAGHVLLAVIMGFTGSAVAGLGVVGVIPGFVAFLFGVAVFFLEVFVATLQAFIFTVLTTIFIAQMVHHEHDDHEGAEAYHAAHPASEDRAAAVTA